MKTTLLIIVAAGLALAGCGTDQCATTKNPAECRAWGDAGGDINDYLVGGMVGYMLANRGGQTVVVRDPGYHGSHRSLHRSLLNENAQLRGKVERQRSELRRQQQARKASIWRTSTSAPRSSSYRSSFRSSGRR